MEHGIEEILQEALRKFDRGAEKYGAYVPETETRDLLREAEEEVLDAINYLCMFLLRLRAVRGKIKEVKAINIV